MFNFWIYAINACRNIIYSTIDLNYLENQFWSSAQIRYFLILHLPILPELIIFNISHIEICKFKIIYR